MTTSEFTVELESEDDLKALMDMLEGTGTLNGIERPVPIGATVTVRTEKRQ